MQAACILGCPCCNLAPSPAKVRCIATLPALPAHLLQSLPAGASGSQSKPWGWWKPFLELPMNSPCKGGMLVAATCRCLASSVQACMHAFVHMKTSRQANCNPGLLRRFPSKAGTPSGAVAPRRRLQRRRLV